MSEETEVSTSLRERALGRIAQMVTPSRAAFYGGVGSLVLAGTAFASGAGIGASSGASYITSEILPDVGIIATALMGLAVAIYGFKWILALVV